MKFALPLFFASTTLLQVSAGLDVLKFHGLGNVALHPRLAADTPDAEAQKHIERKLGSFEKELGGRQLHTDPDEAIVIDTYFHVLVHNEDQGDEVDEETLDKQIQVLNEAFGGMTNSFYTGCDGNPSTS